MKNRRLASIALVAAAGLALAGCSGAGAPATSGTTISIAAPSFPQMKNLAELVPEFESTHPDITVQFNFLEESALKDAVNKDIATGGSQYDIVAVGSSDLPVFAGNGWLRELPELAEDEDYDWDDVFPQIQKEVSLDGKIYAAPFYAETSLLMYRTDLFEAAGLTMPEHPTWDEVATFAKTLNDPSAGVTGIVLRGKPGYGELIAPLTTVVNTFGGQWYDSDWNAQLTGAGFTEATKFYVDLLATAGETDPVSFGYSESLNLMKQGGAAMWYDASVAAGSLEADDSQVAGSIGVVHAPVKLTEESGWLWAWDLAIAETSKNSDAALEFVTWATSKEAIAADGNAHGWATVPPGTRASTYDSPDYQAVSESFGAVTRDVILTLNPDQPGLEPQNWRGIQHVVIPQFPDVGNRVSQEIADAIAGRQTVEQALQKSQEIAQVAGDAQKK